MWTQVQRDDTMSLPTRASLRAAHDKAAARIALAKRDGRSIAAFRDAEAACDVLERLCEGRHDHSENEVRGIRGFGRDGCADADGWVGMQSLSGDEAAATRVALSVRKQRIYGRDTAARLARRYDM